MIMGFIVIGIMFLVACLVFCIIDYNYHSMVFAIIFISLIVASYKAIEYLGVAMNIYYLTYLGIAGAVIYGFVCSAIKIHTYFEIKKYRDSDRV